MLWGRKAEGASRRQQHLAEVEDEEVQWADLDIKAATWTDSDVFFFPHVSYKLLLVSKQQALFLSLFFFFFAFEINFFSVGRKIPNVILEKVFVRQDGCRRGEKHDFMEQSSFGGHDEPLLTHRPTGDKKTGAQEG